MYYVYVLKSINNNWIYVGYTEDLKRRFSEHQRGEVQSTKAHRPFQLIYYEAFSSQQDALRREKYLKTTKGKSTLRMMLRDVIQINDSTKTE